MTQQQEYANFIFGNLREGARLDAVWEMRTDAWRESISRTHAQLSFINLVIYISTAMWHKEENILFIFNNVCLFPFIVLFNCDAIFAELKTQKREKSLRLPSSEYLVGKKQIKFELTQKNILRERKSKSKISCFAKHPGTVITTKQEAMFVIL